ncbi:MAG: prepilin-type N-terminal cleavage/methylation domain-containing protein [Patescibacteria group bacterium]
MSYFISHAKRAFTLIELLVVVAIIGLLATLVAVNVNNAKQKGRDTTRKGNISQLRNALELHYQQYGYFPYSGTDGAIFNCVDALPGQSDTGGYVNHLGDYIKPIPIDPLKAAGVRDLLANGCLAYRSIGSHYKIIANLELDTNIMANDGGVRTCWYEVYTQGGQSFDPTICP